MINRRRPRFNVPALAAVLTAACTPAGSERQPPPPTATGMIIGDVYLVMRSGDVKRGAGQWLYLVPMGGPDSAVAAICSEHHSRLRERRVTLDRIGAELRASRAEIERTATGEVLRLETQRKTMHDSLGAIIDSIRQLRTTAKGWEYTRLRRLDDSLYSERARRSDQFWGLIGQVKRREPRTSIPYPPPVEAIEIETKVRLMALFLGSSADSVKANIDARFYFDSVAPGDYHVFGMTTIGSNQYAWWAPVTVRGGDTVRRDLDNEVEMADRLFSCLDDPGQGGGP